MFSLLSKLQRQPERFRKQLAFLVAVSLTVIITLFWLVDLTATESAKTEEKEVDIGPFQALTEGLGGFLHDVAETAKEGISIFSGSEASPKTDTSEAR